MIEIGNKEKDIKYSSCNSCYSNKNLVKISICGNGQQTSSFFLCKDCLEELNRKAKALLK
ncbi:hypothetical protein ACEXAJ_07315 [Fusobacterium necrophorum subsp. funduliforme]